jgi:nucleotide-binding universal stress UspA family protein
MTAEDRKQLVGEIAGRYGIRIGENDPAFVVANLSQHALQKASAELLEQMDTRLKDFEVVVGRTQARAGKYLGAECREQVAAIRSELQADILAAGTRARELVEEVHRVNTRAVLICWISVGLLSGLALFAAGAWVGAH